MKRKALLLLLVIALLCTTGCGNKGESGTATTQSEVKVSDEELIAKADLEAAVQALNEQQYQAAKGLFDTYQQKYADKEYAEDVSGYIYACSYNILDEYIKHGIEEDFECEDNYYLIMDSFDDVIHIGYEGESHYTKSSSDSAFGKPVAEFNNYYFYLPKPTTNHTVPSTIEWYYVESDALNGYSQMAEANGTFDPTHWFDVSKENGKISIEYTFITNYAQGDETALRYGPTAYLSRIIPYFEQVLEYLDMGISIESLGLADSQKAMKDAKSSSTNAASNDEKISESEASNVAEDFIKNGGIDSELKSGAWDVIQKETSGNIFDSEVKSVSGVSVSSSSSKSINSSSYECEVRGSFNGTNANGTYQFSYYAKITVYSDGKCYCGYCSVS